MHAYITRESRAFVPRQWQRVRVGDFVRLLSDEVIPADLLLLRSSDPGGICYLDTANIDGETSLKQREVARGSLSPPASTATGLEQGEEFNPDMFTGRVHCEQPHNKINDFNGYMYVRE